MRWRVRERLTIDAHDFDYDFTDHKTAYLFARRFACASGAVFVKIFAPNGDVAHEWSRHDNRWLDHVEVPS